MRKILEIIHLMVFCAILECHCKSPENQVRTAVNGDNREMERIFKKAYVPPIISNAWPSWLASKKTPYPENVSKQKQKPARQNSVKSESDSEVPQKRRTNILRRKSKSSLNEKSVENGGQQQQQQRSNSRLNSKDSKQRQRSTNGEPNGVPYTCELQAQTCECRAGDTCVTNTHGNECCLRINPSFLHGNKGRKETCNPSVASERISIDLDWRSTKSREINTPDTYRAKFQLIEPYCCRSSTYSDCIQDDEDNLTCVGDSHCAADVYGKICCAPSECIEEKTDTSDVYEESEQE